jgi:hypothetical protein
MTEVEPRKERRLQAIHVVFRQEHEVAYHCGQIPTVKQNYVVQGLALLTRHLSYFDAKQ